MATRPIRPIIVVEANPVSVDRGQTLAISARLFDKDTMQPMEVSRIFMTITSIQDGHVVWPLEVVRKDASGFDIMVGTEEMKANHQYLIRVSNNWNLSPVSATEFAVQKKTTLLPIIPIIIPLIPLLLPENIESVNVTELLDELKKIDPRDLTPQQRQELKEYMQKLKILKQKDQIITPVDLRDKVKEYIFRTQMDHRVCPICKQYENRVYEPEDPAIPDIPVHINCRCTMDVVYENPEDITEDMRRMAQAAMTVAKTKVARQAISIINSNYH